MLLKRSGLIRYYYVRKHFGCDKHGSKSVRFLNIALELQAKGT